MRFDDAGGACTRGLFRIDQVVVIELGAVLEAQGVQQITQQGVAPERAQCVLDGGQHVEPVVRSVRQGEGLLDGLRLGEGQLRDGPRVGLFRRHAGALEHVERLPQRHEWPFVLHRVRARLRLKPLGPVR